MNRNQSWALKILVLVGVFVGEMAMAFPETIRHGYVQCSACHLSPGGGGLLTKYGRSLSRELLSTWGTEKEEAPLYGLLKLPESLNEQVFVGGDIRYLVQGRKGQQSSFTRAFLMQAQLKVGIVWDTIKLLVSIGKVEDPFRSPTINPVSPEYFLVWNPKEDLFLRAGRFEPIYGLRMPDHYLWTRSELGFVPWAERDTLEIGYEGEKQTVVLSGFQSTSVVPISDQSTGYALSFYQTFHDSSKFGFSAMNREGQGTRFRSASLHGILSHTESLYSMFEITAVGSGQSTKDIVFLRIAHEWLKGLTPYVQAQKLWNRDQNGGEAIKGGIGVNWLPRPHLEFSSTMERVQRSGKDTDEANLLMHFYF